VIVPHRVLYHCAGRQFNVKGELTQRRRAKLSTGAAADGGTDAGDDDPAKRRKSTSVAEHMRQMAAASTEALQRPRKDRERFRRFIVDAVTQGECVPGGRKKVAPAVDRTGGDAGFAEQVPARLPAVSSAPVTSAEKDLLR